MMMDENGPIFTTTADSLSSSPADTRIVSLPTDSPVMPPEAPLPSSVLLSNLIPGVLVLIYLLLMLCRFRRILFVTTTTVLREAREKNCCGCQLCSWRIAWCGSPRRKKTGKRYMPLAASVDGAGAEGPRVEGDGECGCSLSYASSLSPSPPPSPSLSCNLDTGQRGRQFSIAAAGCVPLSGLPKKANQYACLPPQEQEEWERDVSNGVSRPLLSANTNNCHDFRVELSKYFDPTTSLLRKEILSSLDPPAIEFKCSHGRRTLARDGLSSWVDWILETGTAKVQTWLEGGNYGGKIEDDED
jgi:hypothetical protein